VHIHDHRDWSRDQLREDPEATARLVVANENVRIGVIVLRRNGGGSIDCFRRDFATYLGVGEGRLSLRVFGRLPVTA
jgi:hypothetical protein